MIKLNLTTSSEEHELIKAYLEENASEILAEKINNGVRITKDGITFINKKDLDGFMKYASSEAQKLAEKGKNFKAVHHDVVFGWAIHYFEEESIEGTLYNEDGTEYKPVKTMPAKTIKKVETKVVKTPVKQPEKQFTLFDMITPDKVEEKPVETIIDDVEPDEEDIREAMEIAAKEELTPKLSTFYEKYIELENRYPNYAVIYRLGDFYEVLGENAKIIANKIELTLTGRDCGLKERVPMIGFPYHAAESYFNKVLQFMPIVIVDKDKITVREQEKPSINVDLETGEVFDLTEEEMREFDGDIYEPEHTDLDNDEDDDFIETAKRIDKDIMLKLYSLLDEKLTVQ